MIDVLATTLTFVALGVALWGVALMVAGRRLAVDRWYGLGAVGGAALLELGLLVQAVAGFVSLATTDRTVDGFSFAGYLLAPVVVVPLAVLWAMVERTRWGPGVLVIGALAVPVLILRLGQVWDAHA